MAETRKFKEPQTDEEPVEEKDEAGDELPSADRALAKKEEDAEESPSTAAEGDDVVEDVLPAQMGHRRYVYAVFFALGIALAYFLSKAGLALWHRLSQWTPKVGEPREDLMTPAPTPFAIKLTRSFGTPS